MGYFVVVCKIRIGRSVVNGNDLSGWRREFEIVRYGEGVVVDEIDDEIRGFFIVEKLGKEERLLMFVLVLFDKKICKM